MVYELRYLMAVLFPELFYLWKQFRHFQEESFTFSSTIFLQLEIVENLLQKLFAGLIIERGD